MKLIHYVAKCSPRYLSGVGFVRLGSIDGLIRKRLRSEVTKARRIRDRFTSRCTDDQWLLTSALINSLGLIPSSGVTEAYIKACHQEFFEKWQTDVSFRILVDERKNELRNYMRDYGVHRRYIKVDKDNNSLFLCVQDR